MKSLVTSTLLVFLLGLGAVGQLPQAGLPASPPAQRPITPHTAEFVQEQVQLLADGNRIVRRTYQTTYLNAAGIMRVDFFVEKRDPATGKITDERELISTTITDRANGRVISLSPIRKVASLREVQRPVANFTPNVSPMNGLTSNMISGGIGATGHPASVSPPVTSEQLGEKVIEGMTCKGLRAVRTIPAGFEGNERPLQVVSEDWLSSELRQSLESKTIDPRSGETTRKLVRLALGEPDPSVFEIPAGYTTETAPAAVASPSIPLSAPPPAKK